MSRYTLFQRWATTVSDNTELATMPVVYKATNTINGHFYIGATGQTMDHRRRHHCWLARKTGTTPKGLGAAIVKHGESVFAWEVLEEFATRKEAIAAEIRLIAALKPHYNLTPGGDGVVGVVRTGEWNDRIANSLRGKRRTPEQKARMLAARPAGQAYKAVVCLDDGQVFASIKDAAEATGASRGMIGAVCRGEWIAANGYHFAYATKDFSEDERRDLIESAEVRRTRRLDNVRRSRSRPVICVDTGERFESASAASRALGLSPMRVSQICCGEGVTKTGLRFMYEDAGAPPVNKRKSPEELAEVRAKQTAGIRRAIAATSKKVVCLDNGREFKSISDCARDVGRSVEAISSAIRRDGRAAGLRFAFAEKA